MLQQMATQPSGTAGKALVTGSNNIKLQGYLLMIKQNFHALFIFFFYD
jgi:hypothetical protein